jgi:hypothetical protein
MPARASRTALPSNSRPGNNTHNMSSNALPRRSMRRISVTPGAHTPWRRSAGAASAHQADAAGVLEPVLGIDRRSGIGSLGRGLHDAQPYWPA